MMLRLLGVLLLLLGATRLAWPPPAAGDVIHTAAAVADCCIGLLCLLPRWRALGNGLAIGLLSGFAAYNIARIAQGAGGQPCGCHTSLWLGDSSHYATLVLVGALLAGFTWTYPRLQSTGGVRRPLPVAIPVIALGVAYAFLVPSRPVTEPTPADSQIVTIVAEPTGPILAAAPQALAETSARTVESRFVHVLARWLSTRQPVVAADIWLDPVQAQPTNAKTDLDGKAALPIVGGAQRVVGRFDGQWATATTSSAPADVVILEFDDHIVLSGATVDLSERPVPNVALWLRGDGAERAAGVGPYPTWDDRFEERRFSSDNNGYFELRGVTSKLVSIVPLDPRLHLFVGKAPAYFAQVPSRDNLVRVEYIGTYEIRLVSSATGAAVPPPWSVTIDGAAGELSSAFERLPDRIRLHLPNASYAPGSRLKIRASGLGYSVQEREVVLLDGAVASVPLDPDQRSAVTGDIELEFERTFARPPPWTRLTLIDLSGRSPPLSRMPEIANDKWRVGEIPIGEYDVVFMDQRIASHLAVGGDGTASAKADTSTFVTLKIRPTKDGKQLRGSFNINASIRTSSSSRMGSWTVETDDDGYLTLGSFPAGDLDLTEVMRSTEHLAEPVRIVLRREKGPELFAEVKLKSW